MYIKCEAYCEGYNKKSELAFVDADKIESFLFVEKENKEEVNYVRIVVKDNSVFNENNTYWYYGAFGIKDYDVLSSIVITISKMKMLDMYNIGVYSLHDIANERLQDKVSRTFEQYLLRRERYENNY